jgi:outer membrane lipoprotein-sorting protein
MMDTKVTITAFFNLLLTASICWPGGSVESSAGCQGESTAVSAIDKILKRLKQQTAKTQSYQGQVEYRFKQPLLESESLRKGVMYYQKFDGKSKLRMNFLTLKQDDEKEQKYVEHFIFDGVWLTHINYQVKAVRRHQVAELDKPVDAFELASKNLPIIGFTKIEDLKKQFEIGLVSQTESEPTPFIHLHLKVKPDSVYKDTYTCIDFWIDKKPYLPAEVVAVTTEEDIYQIKLLRPQLNKKIDEKVFEFEIPEGFTVEHIPLKKQDKPG